MWNYRKLSVPKRHGNYYISSMNTGLQNQEQKIQQSIAILLKTNPILINNFRIFSLWSNSVLYKQRSLDEEPSVLLDLNELAPDGTLSLSQYYFSNDGTLIGYKVSKSGSDWSEIKIRNVESGQDYPETLKRVKFTDISFTHDNKGFFYAVKLFLYNFMKNASTGQKTIFTSSIFFLLWLSYQSYPMIENTNGSNTNANNNLKLYYHRLGESQDKDVLVAEFLEFPNWQIYTLISHCGKYLILYLTLVGPDDQMYYVDLEQNGEINGKLTIKPIVTELNGGHMVSTNKLEK